MQVPIKSPSILSYPPSRIDRRDCEELPGSQVCVLAVDAKQTEKGWLCYLNGGRVETDKNCLRGQKKPRNVVRARYCSPANHDGVKTGYANEALSSPLPTDCPSHHCIRRQVLKNIFVTSFAGKADAALAASVFISRNQNSRIKIVFLCPRNCDEKMKVSLRLDDLRFTIGITQANHKSV